MNKEEENINEKSIETNEPKNNQENKGTYNFSNKSNFKLEFDNSFIKNKETKNEVEIVSFIKFFE